MLSSWLIIAPHMSISNRRHFLMSVKLTFSLHMYNNAKARIGAKNTLFDIPAKTSVVNTSSAMFSAVSAVMWPTFASGPKSAASALARSAILAGLRNVMGSLSSFTWRLTAWVALENVVSHKIIRDESVLAPLPTGCW